MSGCRRAPADSDLGRDSFGSGRGYRPRFRPENASPESANPRAAGKASDRHAALNLIREARVWFEQHEPSSPIPVLLKRAERLVGKRYADVVTAIPLDLLTQWESGVDDE